MPKQQMGNFWIDGKDVQLPIICKSPDGKMRMYKHLKIINDGFRRYCAECGTVV